MLLFEFGDWRAPLVTAIIAVAVLAGVFGALMLAGMTLNISSFVGAIMMVGIVGENAIFVDPRGAAPPAEGHPDERSMGAEPRAGGCAPSR